MPKQSFNALELQPRRPDAMIDTFELSTEYSNILKNPENYVVPYEDEFSDKEPNELLEGRLIVKWSRCQSNDNFP